MGPSVYVKVVGFRDVERHSLNTMFRLSMGRSTSYGLWTPEAPVAPGLALIDLESYEAALELTALTPNPSVKMICIGHDAPPHAWRTFERPLHWPDVVSAMDGLFAPADQPVTDTDLDDHDSVAVQKTVKLTLLVEPSREDRLYLRARLSLAGHTQVEDAVTGAQALELAKKCHYDLVILGLDIPDMDGWELIRQLVTLEPAIGSVVVTSNDTSWHVREHAETLGCRDLLVKPFEPMQIIELLQKI